MNKLKMFRKSFVSLSLLGCIVASSLPVYASETAESNMIQESESEVTPFWVYDYIITITKDYATSTSIPKSIFYEYYDSTYGWMRGTLDYVSHVYSKGKYVATFRGRMMSNPL